MLTVDKDKTQNVLSDYTVCMREGLKDSQLSDVVRLGLSLSRFRPAI